MSGKFYFAIDRGGTFTDVYGRCPSGKVEVLKLLSEDPQNYKDAPTEGIRRILEQETGVPHSRAEPIDTSQIGWIRMGTTVATNALLERKGERMALAITKGFRDLLHIGNQARPNIFDLEIVCPEVLYEEVIEIQERVIPRQEISKQIMIKDRRKGAQNGFREGPILDTLDDSFLQTVATAPLVDGVTTEPMLLLHSYPYATIQEVFRVGVSIGEGLERVSLRETSRDLVFSDHEGFTVCELFLQLHIGRYTVSVLPESTSAELDGARCHGAQLRSSGR
ncbi:unnamed protein product, partial [Meganyctiphanes norvegica]